MRPRTSPQGRIYNKLLLFIILKARTVRNYHNRRYNLYKAEFKIAFRTYIDIKDTHFIGRRDDNNAKDF